MILFNRVLLRNIMKYATSGSYFNLYLMGGQQPSRQDIEDLNISDTYGRIQANDLYEVSTCLYRININKVLAPTIFNTFPIAKNRFNLANGNLNGIYDQDGLATWFMAGWTDASYFSSASSTKNHIWFCGSVGDLNSTAELKMANPNINQNTLLSATDFTMNVDHEDYLS